MRGILGRLIKMLSNEDGKDLVIGKNHAVKRMLDKSKAEEMKPMYDGYFIDGLVDLVDRKRSNA